MLTFPKPSPSLNAILTVQAIRASFFVGPFSLRCKRGFGQFA